MEQKEVLISFIIPCYNSGSVLTEAIESIQSGNFTHRHEIIVIDDGSTESETIALLSKIEKSGITVIRQANRGVAAARNTGVKKSSGKYLFFLDSDNKVRENYITKGIAIAEKNKKIGVVYADAHFFGISGTPRFLGQPFDPFKLVMNNYIDTCTLVRRRVWDEVGGFDENETIIGYEDWDFWLSISKTEWEFYYLNEIAFDYRISNKSLITQKRVPDNKEKVDSYIYNKHRDLFLRNYRRLYQNYQYQKKHPLKLFMKTILQKTGLKKN